MRVRSPPILPSRLSMSPVVPPAMTKAQMSSMPSPSPRTGNSPSIPRSPFHDNLTDMVVNGKYLFGNTGNGVYVAQFLIEPNGALHWTKSTDVDNFDQPGCSAFLARSLSTIAARPFTTCFLIS